jgi:dienelactone hydrolase
MVLIKEFHKDIQTAGGSTMRIFLFHPNIPNYPFAKFPGVVVFSEIYQGDQLHDNRGGVSSNLCSKANKCFMIEWQ